MFSHTRFDIAYVAIIISQFIHNPNENHTECCDLLLWNFSSLKLKCYLCKTNRNENKKFLYYICLIIIEENQTLYVSDCEQEFDFVIFHDGQLNSCFKNILAFVITQI